jgi:hypothetical protein
MKRIRTLITNGSVIQSVDISDKGYQRVNIRVSSEKRFPTVATVCVKIDEETGTPLVRVSTPNPDIDYEFNHLGRDSWAPVAYEEEE